MALTTTKDGATLRVRHNKKTGRYEVYRKGQNKESATVFSSETEEGAWQWVLYVRNYPFMPKQSIKEAKELGE